MKNEFIENVVSRLIMQGIDASIADTVRNMLIIEFENYTVTREVTDLTVYEGDINDNMLKKFLVSKRVNGRTDRTLYYYKTEIQRIMRSIGKPYSDVTTDDIRLYLARREMVDKVSRTTMNNELRCLRTFYNWLQAEEYITKNPVARIEKISGPTKKKKAFTEIDIELIRDACRTERERAMVEILLSTGCRVSEVIQIKISEINGNQVTVLGKGNKYRTVYLNAKAQVTISKYLAERKDNNPYLFAASNYRVVAGNKMECKPDLYKKPELVSDDGHVKRDYFEQIIRKIGKRAGVEKVHPHRFRRTCATFALRRGMPIEQVSKMLGHESIATTQIYLDLDERELKAMHEKYVV